MLRGKVAVGDDLIELGHIRYVDHRIPAELRMVRNDDDSLRALHHGANRLYHQSAGVAQSIPGDAANAQDRNVRGNALQHSLADGAELYAEARIEIAASQGNFGLLALPKDHGDRNRVSNDLNRAGKKASGDFGYRRSAPQDDRLPILNQLRRRPPDAHLFFLATHREPPEVERLLAGGGGHGPPVNAPYVLAALQFNQIAAYRGPGNIQSGAQILKADEVL